MHERKRVGETERERERERERESKLLKQTFTSSEGIVNRRGEPVIMDQQPCLPCSKPEPWPCKANSLTITNIRISPSSMKKMKKRPMLHGRKRL